MTELALDKIRIDGDTQPRAELDVFVVQDYAEAVLRGDKLPPASVMYDGRHYWLWDGFHRWHGFRKAGRTSMPVTVTTGTVEDARWACLSANQTHGKRRTNEDKQRSVELALRRRADLTDRLIAEHVGVSDKTVTSARLRLESVAEIPQHPTRTGSDGKQYQASKPASKPASKASASPPLTPPIEEPPLYTLFRKAEISPADAATVAHLPEQEQAHVASRGPEAVKEKAAEMRESAPPMPPPETAEQEAKAKVGERWHRIWHDLWMLINSVRDVGGIERIAAKLDARGRQQYASDAERVANELVQWAAAMRRES